MSAMQNRFGTKEFNSDRWFRKFRKVDPSEKEKMFKELLADSADCLGTEELTLLATNKSLAKIAKLVKMDSRRFSQKLSRKDK